jgi:hypothetical protein
VSGSDAALRAAREDAELSARAAQQAAGPPTTVEGFKGHPLYVLQRHITKYQVGPALETSAVSLVVHMPPSTVRVGMATQCSQTGLHNSKAFHTHRFGISITLGPCRSVITDCMQALGLGGSAMAGGRAPG